MRTTLLLTSAALALATSTASAGTVYYGGVPSSSNNGFTLNDFTESESFKLGHAASVNGVTYYATDDFGAPPISIVWSIAADDGGVPGAVIASGTAPVTGNPFSASTSINTFSIPETSLAANTVYWLTLIHANDSSGEQWLATSDASFADNSHRIGGNFYGDGYVTLREPNDLAFSLTGDGSPVPEPTGIALLGTGLLGGLVAIRRKLNR
jgi:PEP-CTERM motif